MYFTDRGIEELVDRRGEEQVTLAWLADRLQTFVDQNPEFETAVDRLATWLARAADEDVLTVPPTRMHELDEANAAHLGAVTP